MVRTRRAADRAAQRARGPARRRAGRPGSPLRAPRRDRDRAPPVRSGARPQLGNGRTAAQRRPPRCRREQLRRCASTPTAPIPLWASISPGTASSRELRTAASRSASMGPRMPRWSSTASAGASCTRPRTPVAASAPAHRKGIHEGTLPREIGPQYFVGGLPAALFPAFDLLEVEVADGVWVSFEFAGALFEVEDQRNWSDASFKTYSAPLAPSFPHTAQAGQQIRQIRAHHDRRRAGQPARGPRDAADQTRLARRPHAGDRGRSRQPRRRPDGARGGVAEGGLARASPRRHRARRTWLARAAGARGARCARPRGRARARDLRPQRSPLAG